MGRQVRALANGVDVLVATPGRLLDLMQSGAVGSTRSKSSCSTKPTACSTWASSAISAKSSRKSRHERQTLFFSATMPAEITELARVMLRDPARVSVTPGRHPLSTASPKQVVHVERAGKAGVACGISSRQAHRAGARLHAHQAWRRPGRSPAGAEGHRRARRSTATSRRTSATASSLPSAKGSSAPWWRPTSPPAASTSKASPMCSTTICPISPETYVHRIGRTARAGAEGVAISFCDR